ncbi:uncharacterized protein ACBR49_019107 isoform 3-T3 [Aulostomus maculatus]
MRGEPTAEAAGHGGSEGEAHEPGNRRPSIESLQNMLKKVSQSPFHKQYKTPVPSPSNSIAASVNDLGNKQDATFISDRSAAARDTTHNQQQPSGQNGCTIEDGHVMTQNGVNGHLNKLSPLYKYYLESNSQPNGMEGTGRKTSEELSLGTIFGRLPEHERSPLDLQQDIEAVENGTTFSEPQKDLFQTFNQNDVEDLFQTSLTPNVSAPDHYSNVTLNSPGLFSANPPQTQNLSGTLESKCFDVFNRAEDLFVVAEGKNSHHSTKEENVFEKLPSILVDSFQFSSNKEEDLFQSPKVTAGNSFYSTMSRETDLFQANREALFYDDKQDPPVKEKALFGTPLEEKLDIFSPSFTNPLDPFPSPILSQDLSSLNDPFGVNGSKEYDPFQDVSTPDIFKPQIPAKALNTSDSFELTPSNDGSRVTYSSPLSSLRGDQGDQQMSPDIFEAAPSGAPAKPADRLREFVLTTPGGTNHGILQPTPFSQAKNMSPDHSPDVYTFKRPPKALPRTRPPRPERPPKPATPIKPQPPKPLPKPVFKPLPLPTVGRKPSTQENKLINPENYVVFEDILLTGQERCVEDWPDDSPELNPDFKPSGTLRLRRESLKVDPDGGSGEDQDSGVHSKRKDKKFRLSLLSRRGSKDKYSDDMKENRSRTLPTPQKSSKDYFSEVTAGENGDGEHSGPDNKNPLKTKVNELLRRGSSAFYVLDRKHISKQESKVEDINKKSVSMKDPDNMQWSEGAAMDDSTGEEEEGKRANHREANNKRKKKVKIKFVPHRGFAIALEKEPKGAYGYTPPKDSREKEPKGAYGYTPPKDSREKEPKGAYGYTPPKDSREKEPKGAYGYTPPKDSREKEPKGAYGYTPPKDSREKEPKGAYGYTPPKDSREKEPKGAYGYTPPKDSREKEPKGAYGYTPPKDSREKEPKGAYGYTPPKDSKEGIEDEVFGVNANTPRTKWQDDTFEEVEEMNSQALQSTSKAAFMDDEDFQKLHHRSPGLQGGEDTCGMEDCKPEGMLDDVNPKNSWISAEELDDDELNGMEDCKPKKVKNKGLASFPRKFKTTPETPGKLISHCPPQQTSCGEFPEDEMTQTGKDFMSPAEMYDSEQDDVETCKPQKKTSKLKGFKKYKLKKKACCEDPPGAACSDYLSEAAQAEWLAAQMDERAMTDLKDAEGDGDTDSLMEWWYTVEKWDEVPSDEEDKVLQEDESKSFTILADKVHRGLRVFHKVFTEHAEVLWQYIIRLHGIADDISEFHQKAKIAGITGGTTTAVGGVTAITGLALAPFTMGISLIVTAVGLGVATAGGITSASATISDNVNNMHDRKKVEVVLLEYEDHLLDIGKILHFINQGLYKLRGHPFLRSGTQHYSEDWEIRRAVQMISLVDSPVLRATEITDDSVTSVQALFQGMDKFFIKETRELKKGCKKELVCQIREVANLLNDCIVELNTIREELQDATGSM